MGKTFSIGLETAAKSAGNASSKMMDHYSSKRSSAMKFYTESEVVAELKKRADSSTQLQVANEMEIHPSMLNDLIHGRRSISDRMANKLGFVKKVVFNKAPKG